MRHIKITAFAALTAVSASLLVLGLAPLARGASKRTATPAALGNYPDASILLSSDRTVKPDAAPTNTTRINVSTSTNFKGKLEGDPITGVVRVTDAHPAGTYTVTVRAFESGGVSTTTTFTLTVTTPATCTLVNFAPATNFGAGTGPAFVAVGDFNGDGQQDVAVVNISSNNVSILLGNGLGSFSAATNFGVGINPYSVAVGDFNGDGKQDLAVANFSSNNVSILLGNGLGSFSAASNFGAGTNPIALEVGEFNGDGNQDVVVANFSSNNVSILLGNGLGSFSAASNFGAGTNPFSVAVGDFNGGGQQDVAVANYGSDNVSILLGNGAGSFGAATNFGTGTNPESVAVGDFNGDSKQDVAVANFGSNDVSILLGNGAGSFSPASNYGAGTSPESVAVGDFNGDGQQDLAVAERGSNSVSILLGDEKGSFSATTNFGVGTEPVLLAVGDFNNDGKQDLAVANVNSNNVSILLRDCAAAPTATPTSTPGATATATPTATVAATATPVSSATPPPPAATFIKAININGNAATINGNSWTSYASALASGFATSNPTYSTDIAFSPGVDSETNGMLNTGIYCPSCDVNFSQTLPNGNYQIYLWAVENYLSNHRSYDVQLEGTQVAAGIGSLANHTWQRYGPYSVTVSDGALDVNLVRVTGDPLIQGIEIWSPTPASFVKGVNLNGNAATINGNSWISYGTALGTGFATSNPTYSTNITFSPAVDSATNGMLNTGIYCPSCDVNFSQTLANGNYQVYLWAVENNVSNSRSYDVKIEGTQVADGIGSLANHTWQRYGPYSVTVSDGVLDVNLVGLTGDPLVQGIEIWSVGAPTGTPTPTATATATATPTATVAATATPVSSATPPPPAATFIKAININGNAATINGNSWTSYASALASGFATSNPTYSTDIAFSPGVDSETNGMLNTGIYCPSCDVNFSQTLPNGNYQIYLWAVENYLSNHRSYDVQLEGTQVAAGIGSLANHTWQRYGPYSVTVSDGALDVNLVRVTGDPLIQGIEIWSPTPASFVKGVNLNGNAATINGNSWISYGTALGTGFATSNPTYSTNITFSPAVDSATNGMLNTGIYCPSCDVNFSQTLANGNYQVYLWAVENNVSNSRSYDVKIEGTQVADGIGSLANHTWQRYGPYSVTVSDGVLDVNLVGLTGDPLVQGIEIWSVGAPTGTPTPTATAAATATPTATVAATATPVSSATPPPPAATFIKAININGNAATINGNSWTSYASALASGFATSNPTYSTDIAFSPGVDSETNGMLNTGIYCPSCDVNFSQTLPNGNYQIYLWAVENYLSNHRSYDVQLEGTQVAAAIGSLANHTWQRYGPYSVTVSDGALDVNLVRVTGDPLVQGIEIWSPTPASFVKGVNLNGNAATINGNSWISYGTALGTGFATSNPTYSTNITFSPAVDSATNGMLNTGIYCPSCDVNFSQTLANGNYQVYLWAVENNVSNSRSYDVKIEGTQVADGIGSLANHTWQRYGPYSVTVSDGVLDVNLVGLTGDPVVQGIEIWTIGGSIPTPTPPPSFVKAININGSAANINGNSWTSYANALGTGFATANPTYSSSFTFSPIVDSATNGMLNTGIWCPACDVNFSQTLANGNYVVYLWAVENYVGSYRSSNVRLEGVQVAAAIGSLPLNTWERYGPYSITVNDGVLNVSLVRVMGDPVVQGIEIWSAGGP